MISTELLHRADAPFSPRVWEAVDAEADRALRHFLAARRVVDVTPPQGWSMAAVNLGTSRPVAEPDVSQPPGDLSTSLRVRDVAPVVELRVTFDLPVEVADEIDRGGRSPDLSVVADAARRAASAENSILLHGLTGADVRGVVGASPHRCQPLGDDAAGFAGPVGEAVELLRDAGVNGPYALLLGPRWFATVAESTERGGYPVADHLRSILGGPLVWTPEANGAVLVSQRGGDLELVLGADFGLGFDWRRGGTAIFVEESFSFVVHTPEAVVPIPPA